jgi:Rrf2 family transcriptional regulator, nitric oxide-sensitive transcriptional repressor
VQLTTFTDYSLRVLISVAAKENEELSTIPEIAAQYGISRNHLIKVVHHLSRSGYLATVRGKGGGFRLARPAIEIRIGDVIRSTEAHLGLVPCMDASGKGGCVIEPVCVLRRALREALRAFLDVTDGYTLADLIRPRSQLRTLLSVPA